MGIDLVRAPEDGFLRALITDWMYGYYCWPEITGGEYRGRTLLYRSVPNGVLIEGVACAVGLRDKPKIGFRREAAGVRVHLSSAPRNSTAFLMVGVSRDRFGPYPLPFDLTPLGFVGCMLYTSADVALPSVTGGSGVAAGYAFVDIPLPLIDTGGGLPLYAQWKVFDAPSAGAGLSEMLTWQVQL